MEAVERVTGSDDEPFALPGVGTLTVLPVILSGGAGTRLWPLSRPLQPKQLLPVAAEQSMLRETLERVAGDPMFGPAIIVGGEDHRFLIAHEADGLSLAPGGILLEPTGRNTAAAIALAAHFARSFTPGDPLLLVMPSDHVIADIAAFKSAIRAGAEAAARGRLVTFGIEPTEPATGYGYIARGEAMEGIDGAYAVRRFVEKPDRETAAAYLAGGEHLWNGGIFLFGAEVFLAELRRLQPGVAGACAEAMAGARPDGPFTRPDAVAFASSPAISVDYAVMEQTDRAAVVPVDMGWSDVGSWDALWAISAKDDAGNAVKGDVVAVDSHNSLLRVENGAPIRVVGLDDAIVVSTRDAVLVAPKSRAQDVKLVVDELAKQRQATEAVGGVVHRPWGTSEVTDRDSRFQVKRLTLSPGAKLSMQMHRHRSEHWIVVAGTAKVTVGGRELFLAESESTFIPAGAVHRLENAGATPLQLIEVQCGNRLSEDDIVRYGPGHLDPP